MQDGTEWAKAAVDAGARTYFAQRRARIVPFVDAHFSWAGTLRLHRAALGWDVVRAPLNLSLAVPQLVLQLLGRVLGRRWPRTGALLKRPILLRTAVGRQLEWLIVTELLELPLVQGRRRSDIDALAGCILDAPDVAKRLELAGQPAADPAFRERLSHAMAEYGVTRAAAAEITTGLLNLGAGGIALHKLTPGAVTLGPVLAGSLAQQSALAAFPLGGWLGGLWYGWFPAHASPGFVTTVTTMLMLGATVFAAFAGIIADPVQRALGLHRRRLARLVAALEQQFFDEAAPGFVVHDHYVARLLDVFDMVGAAVRLARL